MNKLFIVILAVCLISVNSALVKREAEKASPNYVEEIQNKLKELSDNINKEVAGAFDVEKLKKSINEGIDSISKALDLDKKPSA